jgi:predicted phosphodiesterase
MRKPRPFEVTAYFLVWLLTASALSVAVFLSSSASTTVASHDATVSPTVDGWVTVHTGPFLPDVRRRAEGRIGVDITLGKTEATSTEALVHRYAFIASQPDAQIARVEETVRDLAYDAALRGAAIAVVPLGIWALVGAARRRELASRAWSNKRWTAAGTALVLAGVGVLVWQPWQDPDPVLARGGSWQPLERYVSGVTLPDEAAGLEITDDVTTNTTRRLVLSAVDTYRRSKDFYAAVRDRVDQLTLHQPADDETVAIIVSDRHDNIGMDPVALAIAERGGADVVLDAGDDTSTGSDWETFSLDSLNDTFDGFEKYAIAGNHDHGDLVSSYLHDRGWTTATGEPVPGPGGSTLLSFDDPRSSGLGNWRDESGLSVPELAVNIADVACASEKRVNTLLVHDADMGTAALERGCVDLVVSGHVHVRIGPTLVTADGERGYAYTNGTTGGAAYAIAVGSKLRRPAEVTLVTYRDGRPVGLQPVRIQTTGLISAAAYIDLGSL